MNDLDKWEDDFKKAEREYIDKEAIMTCYVFEEAVKAEIEKGVDVSLPRRIFNIIDWFGFSNGQLLGRMKYDRRQLDQEWRDEDDDQDIL